MNGPIPNNTLPSPAEKAWMLGAISHAIPLVSDPHASAGLVKSGDIIAALPERRLCRECLYFDQINHCDKWAAEIPAEWLEQGCAEWQDAIPF